MLTSLNMMLFFVAIVGLVPFSTIVALARQPSKPKLSGLELIKDLLRKRADIIKGKPVYVFSKSDRRIWLEEVEKCLNETR